MTGELMATNSNPNPTSDGSRRLNAGRVAAGAIVMGMGILVLLDRTEVLGEDAWRLFPGFALIAIGLAQLTETWTCRRRGRSPRIRGLGPIFVGLWLIANAVHVYGLTYRTSWPLLIVAFGAVMVLHEVFPGEPVERIEGHPK